MSDSNIHGSDGSLSGYEVRVCHVASPPQMLIQNILIVRHTGVLY